MKVATVAVLAAALAGVEAQRQPLTSNLWQFSDLLTNPSYQPGSEVALNRDPINVCGVSLAQTLVRACLGIGCR